MSATIEQTIGQLRATLVSYIEATYHIGNPTMVRQRQRLLEQVGGIYQNPYLESTPRYVAGERYADMTGLPDAVREAFVRLSDATAGAPVIFDPPYRHQEQAVREVLVNGRNLMVMTGTGSGKTESFLLPILGKLALEAKASPRSFREFSAVRAIILYPMNALVNDQLGRLRLLFGNPRVVEMFEEWAGRPARFARYTSRTPYAGVRMKNKDSDRLASMGSFFANIETAARRHMAGRPLIPTEDEAAFELFGELKSRGKWPAKESVADWYGKSGDRWLDAAGEFKRAVLREHDAELMTRHEVHENPPDLLITNYSMLEYMMMRPIERPIFDKTRAWLKAFPEEKILVVMDEAHLYRGAQGAEVGLLLRRFRERLGLDADRFQVICATASFDDKDNAGDFGSQLTGVDKASFKGITGDLAFRSPAACGSATDVAALNSVDMAGFYESDVSLQQDSVRAFLDCRGTAAQADVDQSLHEALVGYAPFNMLVNETMQSAVRLTDLSGLIFPNVDQASAATAVGVLLALGSRARTSPEKPSLLPCRIHSFFRGLPGLWVCMDAECSELADNEKGGPAGKMYSQPRDRCPCGTPVLEYFTCRHCGTSYARAYTDDVVSPKLVWATPGERLQNDAGFFDTYKPIDILLEEPAKPEFGRSAIYDLNSGLLDPDGAGENSRVVYLQPAAGDLIADDDEEGGAGAATPGEFAPCACCRKSFIYGQSSVQDHQTKGDQPFQALLSTQVRIQPPGPQPGTEFAPLRGRKVLIFSDSRQMAAR
jgi:DEAD/DEAH box helicase